MLSIYKERGGPELVNLAHFKKRVWLLQKEWKDAMSMMA